MSRNSSSMVSSLVLPGVSSSRGWKPAERVVQDVSAAVLWRENEDGSSSSTMTTRAGTSLDTTKSSTSEDACSVCREHQSRYTCPRCQAPYCSVECYKNHTASTSTEDASACTEAFFKSRVSSILDLEAKEQKGNTQRMLNQLYQRNVSHQQGDVDDDETDLSDQLYELLHLLEEKQDKNLSQEELMAMVPLELRVSFQRDIQEGKIQDVILEQWHPWWRRQFVSAEELPPPSIPASSTSTSSKPLDERLLQVPQFSTICRTQQSSEIFLFHLVDILYSFCWTLRLYHGLQNVIAKPTPQSTNSDDAFLAVEAAATCIQHSAVLNTNDTRFTSMEQVLSACTAASTKCFPDGCNAEWDVLVEDCALLLVSHRLVGRALLEAQDLLKASIQCLKREDQSSSGTKNTKESIGRLRQLRKKLEFFLSWSQHAKSEFGESIKTDLMDWVRRWKSDEFAIDKSGNPTSGLVDLTIPDSQGTKGGQVAELSASSRQVESPLLVEVATTRCPPKKG